MTRMTLFFCSTSTCSRTCTTYNGLCNPCAIRLTCVGCHRIDTPELTWTSIRGDPACPDCHDMIQDKHERLTEGCRTCAGCNSYETPALRWVSFRGDIYCQPCIDEYYVQREVDERPAPADCCPGCGDRGATVLGSDYCHTCLSVRDHPCNRAFIEDTSCLGCGIQVANGEDTCEGCAVQYSDPASACTCSGGGRMCDHCTEEYKEPCRGCGEYSHLWVDNRYCRECYVDRHGYEFPPPPLPPSPTRSPEELREIIAEIEARLLTNMTKEQKDDWIWLLQNRRADLAEAEKEMWEGYDQDDLRKMDLANRRG